MRRRSRPNSDEPTQAQEDTANGTKSPKVSTNEIVLVLSLVVATRIGYSLLGVRFNTSVIGTFWQFLDQDLLHHDLIRSVWALHSQPPLMNLLAGLFLKLPQTLGNHLFHALFLLGSLAMSVALLVLQVRLGISRAIRVTATLLFVLSPAVVLYENFFFYTHLATVMVALAALFLYRFVGQEHLVDGALFFSLMAAATLTRSLYHPIILLLLALALVCIGAGFRRRVLLAAALPLLIAGAWFLRGYVLFGVPSGSSWLGMSLAQMVGRMIPEGELHELAKDSPRAAILRIRPFSPITDYNGMIPRPKPSGYRALDDPFKENGLPNFNYRSYIPISGRYLDAFFWLLQKNPTPYCKAVWASQVLFFRSPSDSEWLGANLVRIEPVDRWFRLLVYGQLERFGGTLSPRSVSWSLVVLLPIVICRSLWWALSRIRRYGWRDPSAVTVLFMLGMIAWVYAVGNLCELGENNRFLYLVLPLAMVLTAKTVSLSLPSRA